jgi:hypothetical protein
MPRNAFLDEAKSEYWPVAVAGIDKVRLQATVVEVLDDARPATTGKGDQLIHGAVKVALIEAIIAGRFRAVHATLGKLLGLDTTSVKLPHDREVDDRKPLGKAAAR